MLNFRSVSNMCLLNVVHIITIREVSEQNNICLTRRNHFESYLWLVVCTTLPWHNLDLGNMMSSFHGKYIKISLLVAIQTDHWHQQESSHHFCCGTSTDFFPFASLFILKFILYPTANRVMNACMITVSLEVDSTELCPFGPNNITGINSAFQGDANCFILHSAYIHYTVRIILFHWLTYRSRENAFCFVRFFSNMTAI